MKRWITPVGLSSHVEIQTVIADRKIRLYPDGQKTFITLTMDEARKIRDDFDFALNHLREEVKKYEEHNPESVGGQVRFDDPQPDHLPDINRERGKICCDPGNENRPREGCDCDCCEELRYVRLRPEMPTLP
jgi:hypothetical protein